MRELALSEAATHGEQGCRPRERGAAQCHSPRPGELAARRSRGQLDSYQRLPGNYCDSCAKDTARAGAPQSRGARDAGLHRGLSDQQRLEQATGGRDLLSRKCSEKQPCGHAAGARRHHCRAATEGGPKGDPGSSRRTPLHRSCCPTPTAGGACRLRMSRAAQGAEACCSQGHSARRRDEVPHAPRGVHVAQCGSTGETADRSPPSPRLPVGLRDSLLSDLVSSPPPLHHRDDGSPHPTPKGCPGDRVR